MQVFESKLQQLLAGTQKDLPSTSTLSVNGQQVKVTDIVTQLQGWIALYDKVAAAKQAYAPAQQSLQAALPQAKQFATNLTKALKVFFGDRGPQLADFGIAVTAPKTPSAATKVIAKAKAAATRKARGTLGKQQRKKVTSTESPTLTVTLPTGQPAPQTGTVAPTPVSTAAAVATGPGK